MAFVKDYKVFEADKYGVQTLTGFKHWHSESMEPHQHLIGGQAEYVNPMWNSFAFKGDHYHRVDTK